MLRVLVSALFVPSVLAACADASPIQSVDSSKSHFDGAVYPGEVVVLSQPTSGAVQYRIFHQGATGFVPLQAVRASAEERATDFCARKGKTLNEVREIRATPPYVLGNFPRVEIVFECVEKTPGPETAEGKYESIAKLKRLLDTGAITQDEFDREKRKLLSQ
jgi:hypothetical protein